jgi:hypothetical protein
MCENPSVKPACAIPLNFKLKSQAQDKTEMKKVKSGAPDLLGLIPEAVYGERRHVGIIQSYISTQC